MAGAQLGLEELELEEQSRLEEPVLERVSGQMTREDAAIIAGLLADVMTAETMLKRQVKEDQTQLEKWSGASSTTQVSSSSPPSFTPPANPSSSTPASSTTASSTTAARFTTQTSTISPVSCLPANLLVEQIGDKKPVAAQNTMEKSVLVPCPTLPQSGHVPVVMVLVESASRVWVVRKEDFRKVKRMMEVLQLRAPQLAIAKDPICSCIYGAMFSEDGIMYRVVVEKIEEKAVLVSYVDFGNVEWKRVDELIQLTSKMALYPATAFPVEVGMGLEDSPANRDIVEKKLEGNLKLIILNGRVPKLQKAGLLPHSKTPAHVAKKPAAVSRKPPTFARKPAPRSSKSPTAACKSPSEGIKSPPVARKSPPVASKSPPLARKSPAVTSNSPPLARKSPPVASKSPPNTGKFAPEGRKANRRDREVYVPPALRPCPAASHQLEDQSPATICQKPTEPGYREKVDSWLGREVEQKESQALSTAHSDCSSSWHTGTSSPSPPVSPKPVPESPAPPSPATSRSALLAPTKRQESPPGTYRGPKVDPRWPICQQLLLGPIPMGLTWIEIREALYSKTAPKNIVRCYVQSRPVDGMVYGQVILGRMSEANMFLKDGSIQVHLLSPGSLMTEILQRYNS